MMLGNLLSPHLMSSSQIYQDLQKHTMQPHHPAAVSGASGNSSACAAPFDSFYRSTSSTRSSFDGEEQQSERSSVPGFNPHEDSTSPPHSPQVPFPTASAPYSSAAEAASAMVAAFSAFYGASAFNTSAAQSTLLQPIQLTIQPLDVTQNASHLTSSLGASATDAFRNLTWQEASTAMALSAFKMDASALSAPAGSTDRNRCSFESSTSSRSVGKVIHSDLLRAASSAGCSSDDHQSWPAPSARQAVPAEALERQQQQERSSPLGPTIDQSGAASRAAITSANRRGAIIRFRQKREQRTFNKKVRYVSRKRLAEARPRVRGQFVKAEVAAAFLAEQEEKLGANAAAGAVVVPMDMGQADMLTA